MRSRLRFILQNPSFYSFLWLIGLPVFWRWHHLPVPPHHQLPQADNWWENQRWQIHLIQLPLNEQRGTTSLWSFPFDRCIHSDYITWLSKWLCMHIIPSFLVDKASCTRQFESELSLHSLASLFPIKEGIFSNPSVSLSKGSSTSNQAFLLRRKDVNRPTRCSEPLRSKVGGPSKVFAILCGMGPPGEKNKYLERQVIVERLKWHVYLYTF